MAIVETWLSPNVRNCELFPANYVVYRCDRDSVATGLVRGGGSLLAAKNNYIITSIDLSLLRNSFPLIDIVGCKWVLTHVVYFLYVIYIPPQVNVVLFDAFLQEFEQVVLAQNNVIILGDFNVSQFIVKDVQDPKTQSIVSFINILNMKQLNETLNVNNRQLDLIISSINCSVVRESTPLVGEDSHHPALVVTTHGPNVVRNNFPVNLDCNDAPYNFKKADFVGLYNNLLEVDWEFLDNIKDVDLMCNLFYDQLYNIIDKFVPKFKTYKRKYPPWYDSNIRYCLKVKYSYFKKYKSTNSVHYYREFSRIRNHIKRLVEDAYKNYLLSVQTKITSDPKTFWTYIRTKLGTSRIPSNISYRNTTFADPQSTVNGFAQFFSSVFNPKNVDVGPFSNPSYASIVIKELTEKDLLPVLKHFKNKMTSGHDFLPSFLIKDCAYVLVIPLLKIFNTILKTSVFPNRWKLARVCPVLKTGSSGVAENYRPISILCNFAKAFEKVVYNLLLPQVKPFISTSQHGFLSKRSTVTNLSILNQTLCTSLDQRHQVDVIYTDFSKAFDKLDHGILLEKLNTLGFSDSLLLLFSSYLSNREQFVAYNGYKSFKYLATSGVPQGSNLGPLLFLLFINDLCSSLTCGNLLFADDLKIYTIIYSTEDCMRFQEQLSEVVHWCEENKLLLNPSKCKVCSFTRNKNVVFFQYKINDIIVTNTDTVLDLGVLYDSKLSFKQHVDNITKSALKSLGFMMRNCNSFNNQIALKQLYFTLVRSHLEYCSLIWFPIYGEYKIKIENVQRRFLKFLNLKVLGFYPQRGYNHRTLLNIFNFQSLEARRIVTSLLFLYKLLHNHVDAPKLLESIHFNAPVVNTRNFVPFHLPVPSTNMLLKSPIYIMCSYYNDFGSNCDIFYYRYKQFRNCIERDVSI